MTPEQCAKISAAAKLRTLNRKGWQKGKAMTMEARQKMLRTRCERSTLPPATQSPTLADLHWAAGFIEGEGDFRGVQTKSGVVRTYSSMSRVTQVNKEPVVKLQALLGGSLRWSAASGPNCSDKWVWSVSGARARGVIMTLYPLMSARRQLQMRTALGLEDNAAPAAA